MLIIVVKIWCYKTISIDLGHKSEYITLFKLSTAKKLTKNSVDAASYLFCIENSPVNKRKLPTDPHFLFIYLFIFFGGGRGCYMKQNFSNHIHAMHRSANF